jgi:hypothetical protein
MQKMVSSNSKYYIQCKYSCSQHASLHVYSKHFSDNAYEMMGTENQRILKDTDVATVPPWTGSGAVLKYKGMFEKNKRQRAC